MPGCGMWLRSKGRYCSGAALPGSNYCGNHHWHPSSALRVPCPLDASHTVAANRVEAHVTKCPAAKQLQAVKQCAYYSPGLNAGSDVDDDADDADDASYTQTGDAGRRTSVTESLPRDKDKVEELVSKIEAAYTALVRFEDSFVSPAACTEWLSSQTDRRHPFQEKHVVQQASMLGNLEQFGLLGRCDKAVAFIEFGAGRGYLSHMLSDCYAAHKVLLVERRSYKFKADRTLRYSTRVSLSRLRVDIEDLNLDAVEALQGCSSVVGVSKHLCGAATDMALRCCMRSERLGVAGVGIATCCHHLCGWKAYVGKEVLASVGIERAEFEAMARLSSWAVSGPIPDSDSDSASRGRADLGLKCKRVIDMGRVLWLQQQQGGMQAKMVRYVPSQTSPENILILAQIITN